MTIKEWFRDWNGFCIQQLKKPDGMPFSPAYLVKAFAAVQEWFLSSRVATKSLPLEQSTKLYLAREGAIAERRVALRERAAAAQFEQEYDE